VALACGRDIAVSLARFLNLQASEARADTHAKGDWISRIAVLDIHPIGSAILYPVRRSSQQCAKIFNAVSKPCWPTDKPMRVIQAVR
jgi:hypothetical protein